MALRSMEGGFMEPINHAKYYEDAYTKVASEDDEIEAHTFDLCEDSSDAEIDDSKVKHKRKTTHNTTSYGSIKKLTYKSRIEASQQSAYKIAPNRNPRHSIRLPSEDSDEHERSLAHLDVLQSQSGSLQNSMKKLTAKAFAEEKAWQRQLCPTARFNSVLKIRAENRLRLHNACQRARKTKARALKDAETAASCLIEAAPEGSSYIQIDGGEVPTDFVDLTGRCARRTERRLADKPWPPRNWKGEEMVLTIGGAYVLVMDREQGGE